MSELTYRKVDGSDSLRIVMFDDIDHILTWQRFSIDSPTESLDDKAEGFVRWYFVVGVPNIKLYCTSDFTLIFREESVVDRYSRGGCGRHSVCGGIDVMFSDGTRKAICSRLEEYDGCCLQTTHIHGGAMNVGIDIRSFGTERRAVEPRAVHAGEESMREMV